MSIEVVIAGGGWAGCAAAYGAVLQGAKVTLLEKTDMLLGTGLVGGIMRNNGRYTATEEMIALGGGEIFRIIDENIRHKNVEFPGHEHASLYDVGKISGVIYRFLKKIGTKIEFQARMSKVQMDGKRILNVQTDDGRKFGGEMFIDATGSAGPMNNCRKFGNGCAMCILRCPSFGGRISLTGEAGIPEIQGKRANGKLGAMSGSCKLFKESLSGEIIDQLEEKGVAVIPLPEDLRENHLSEKACQQYALDDFTENIILLDTGHAKLMTSYFPIDKLRRIPGFEDARYEDPYAGGKGNSIRYMAMSPRDNSLKVEGAENLYCAGEKAGLLVGHTEAIVTGILAGYNSVREASGLETLILPESLAVGDMIAFVKKEMGTEEGIERKYTFSGSVYFKRMKDRGLYLMDINKIKKKVEMVGLKGVFSNRVVHDL
ncbi:FAD-dependent oxidoreductase [Robinsoniella peoriensis]|uniref:tRNA (Uracil-5-)-methyltransferase Gid n=2 Tax=Robinsoniella TaxID=588605 RepID=A0A4U8QCP8_9FIRM|nr:FAD-dependent oxidoreductase [Robinsoniella peoriensis]MDU7030573.1 FAD-dependent oxidoreductase [Clostridiales bacterium]TLD02509.1 tRNA (uracil-5-)-methyltransferase Gid [Robinsoniella peoriensis]